MEAKLLFWRERMVEGHGENRKGLKLYHMQVQIPYNVIIVYIYNVLIKIPIGIEIRGKYNIDALQCIFHNARYAVRDD